MRRFSRAPVIRQPSVSRLAGRRVQDRSQAHAVRAAGAALRQPGRVLSFAARRAPERVVGCALVNMMVCTGPKFYDYFLCRETHNESCTTLYFMRDDIHPLFCTC